MPFSFKHMASNYLKTAYMQILAKADKSYKKIACFWIMGKPGIAKSGFV